METLYFILGALSVVTIIAVVSVFKIKREMSEMVEDRLDVAVNHLSSYIERVERNIDEADNNLEAEINKVDEARGKQHFEHIDYVDTLHNNLMDEMNKLYGYVDSRTDKMATNVSKHIAEINQAVDALK